MQSIGDGWKRLSGKMVVYWITIDLCAIAYATNLPIWFGEREGLIEYQHGGRTIRIIRMRTCTFPLSDWQASYLVTGWTRLGREYRQSFILNYEMANAAIHRPCGIDYSFTTNHLWFEQLHCSCMINYLLCHFLFVLIFNLWMSSMT